MLYRLSKREEKSSEQQITERPRNTVPGAFQFDRDWVQAFQRPWRLQ